MTYTELVAQIQAFTENTFPDAYLADGGTVSSAQQIKQFIELAEQRIYNSVQFPSLRRNVTGFTSSNNKYLACPTDFLSVYSIAVIDATGRYEYLLNKDVNFIRQAYPSPNSRGIPKYYALFGPSFADSAELSFILGPTPDASYNVELHYFFYPQSITETPSGTTWLGDNFDSVLLYGALVEAAIFMKAEAETLLTYQKKYEDALAQAKRLGDGLERGDAYRNGQYRQAVQ
jgi:hypothetical protein